MVEYPAGNTQACSFPFTYKEILYAVLKIIVLIHANISFLQSIDMLMGVSNGPGRWAAELPFAFDETM